MRADSPLAHADQVTAQDERGVNLLHRPDCGVSAHLRAHLEQEGIPLRPTLRFARDDDLLSFLAGAAAVAYLPTALQLRKPLVRRAFCGPDCGFDLFATTVSSRPRGPALNLFLSQLRTANWIFKAA